MPISERPTLAEVVQDRTARNLIAADAVLEARAAIKSRRGLTAMASGVGFDTIERIRPGLLERHVHAMLPELAGAVEPYWVDGMASGDPTAHFDGHDFEIANALMDVVDNHVADAVDTQAIALYNQLRGHAPKRIAEQMPRLVRFIDRHTSPPGSNKAAIAS